MKTQEEINHLISCIIYDLSDNKQYSDNRQITKNLVLAHNLLKWISGDIISIDLRKAHRRLL